ncbi:Storkhead-box protein 1 [Portunus trituberculatus]|uniref:Storkhead-box protein 1 n=1 Tax=Portunus trituberculatus TaxID=210409 RepID=A0A5B7CYW9_PORTR|nr:Storkhead-box protein 1 [Portunus trituberculatus]
MGERKLIQKRCLAVQLFKKEVTISSPASCDSSSGDTATPVNDPSTATPASTNHQDGLHLFRGQFTPLADALCWVVHHLTREGCKAGAEAVREALESSFPTMMSPSPSHVHATLSSLIQQCKVYYTGATYGIVQPGTYLPSITPGDEAPVLAKEGFVSVAAQTDLAELITGAAHASDTVIIPTLSGERGSVFSKLLRVPGRRRIVSFAAQFPPPEWSDSHAPVVHLHSVAVQTSNQTPPFLYSTTS